MKPQPPKELDAIVDKVLAYRPKPKSEAGKKRKRKAKKMMKAAKDFAKKVEGCQYQVVPKAGHIANVDRRMAAFQPTDVVTTVNEIKNFVYRNVMDGAGAAEIGTWRRLR